ncbi:MAG: hypothetical protein HW381_1847, partial [Candidatus Rokubacteria bacterium]|nr:hypothetical protein [Candidatus Rokubacteria bacterium]
MRWVIAGRQAQTDKHLAGLLHSQLY